MVARVSKTLGSGLYTVREAALYARVPTALMSRWLFAARGRAVIEPEFGPDEKLVSFLDFIQTLAIREIRIQRKVPLVKFRQAIATAKSKLHFDYPFARRHCTFLSPAGELVIRRGPGEDFVEASGKDRGQKLFHFMEYYLKDLTYDAAGLAESYCAYASHHPSPVRIVMKPGVRFGEPLLPSGYTALTIYQAVLSEGGPPRVAKAYGIPVEEAEAAYQYVVNYLNRAA